MKVIIRNVLFFLSGWFKKHDDILIFGSWFGKRIGDNSKYLLDYYLNDSRSKGNKIYWIGEKKLQNEVNNLYGNNVVFLEINKISTYLVILKARYLFVSHGYNDLGRFNLSRNAIVTQLWHGYPFKKIAYDSGDVETSKKHYYSKYSYFLSASNEMDKRLLSAFRYYGINESNIIRAGFPRNDIFFNPECYLKIIDRFKIANGIEDSDIIVSYLPTFRDTSSSDFSFSDIGDHHIQDLKDKRVKIIEKRHLAASGNAHNDRKEIIKIADEIDTQLLLLISDILVTDYSSVFADYSLLDRPIIHFLYDKDYYINNDRGLYSNDFHDDAMGPIVYDIDDLVKVISENIDEDKNKDYRQTKMKKIMEYNLENNSDHIINEILNRN